MAKSFMSFIKKKGKEACNERGMPSNEKLICYVLISCFEPDSDGHMHVEMTYEGDRVLASYLVKSAQGMLDKES